MRARVSAALSATIIVLLLVGCAGPVLNEYTVYLGPTIGSIEERQVLQNLGRFVDNPWAIPGHVELANGQIQATNQAGINLKYPFSAARTSSSVTSAVTTVVTKGNEFDLNPAQTQDQESYNILPVTDPDDLRRLRAIYHYAICPDPAVFGREWEIADQYFFRSSAKQPAPSTTSKPDNPPSPAGAAQRTVRKLATGVITNEAAMTQLQKDLGITFSDVETEMVRKLLAEVKPDSVETTTKNIIKAVGLKEAAPAPSKSSSGAKSDQNKSSSGGDTTAFEQKKGMFIVSQFGLGTTNWLFFRIGPDRFITACPENPVEVAVDPRTMISLGVYNRHEFFTNDLKKLGDLV
jgi:hypothetical protein